MIALGIDVGATSGLALLRVEGRLVTWIDGMSTREHPLDTPYFAGVTTFDVLGIECIEGYAHGENAAAKVKDLMAGADLAGQLKGWARAKGLRCYSKPAVEWRKYVVGTATPTDDEVKRAVTMLVTGLPKRSSSHARDAAVAAMGAAQTARIDGMRRSA